MSSFVPIYAVDFDGTLCESKWPGIGAPNKKLIQHLVQRRTEGAKVILWTCRVEEHLKEAVDWCSKFGLEFDAVNDNLPENVENMVTIQEKCMPLAILTIWLWIKENTIFRFMRTKRSTIQNSINTLSEVSGC